MKKSTLFLACCLGLMLFASCKKDPIAPTISIYEDVGCVIENAQVYSGNEICVGFACTGEDLTQIEIVLSQDGTVLASHSENITYGKNEPVTPFFYEHCFIIEATGVVTIKGTVTDAIGQTASKSFNVNYEEKPSAKFVGHYEGESLFTGTMKAEIAGMDPMEQEVTDEPFPVILDLVSGEDPNEVTGTCKIDDQEMEMKGTVEGNMVTFEAVNTIVTFNYDMNGFSISPQMNVTYYMKGTLDNETLTLDGTCTGDGELHVLIYNGTISIDGTLSGSLTKQ
jgi:hypothetical protein